VGTLGTLPKGRRGSGPNGLGASAGAGDEGGDDVAGVTIEVVAGPVPAGGGARIRLAGSDLHVAERHPSVEDGGNGHASDTRGPSRPSRQARA